VQLSIFGERKIFERKTKKKKKTTHEKLLFLLYITYKQAEDPSAFFSHVCNSIDYTRIILIYCVITLQAEYLRMRICFSQPPPLLKRQYLRI
jgi:hypothetical protein